MITRVAKALGQTLAVECDVVGLVFDGSEVVAAPQRLDQSVVVDVNPPNVNRLDICVNSHGTTRARE
jgi:hypothetical protein